jgi:preprotein translocase subunit SecE
VAQQENAPNKPVHLIYLVGAVTAFYLLQWTIDWVWGYFGTSPSDFQVSMLAAIGATIFAVWMYRSDKYYTLANEVSSELKKVTWPTAKEVRQATLVVIVMAVLSAMILGLFDFIWSNLTEFVYG